MRKFGKEDIIELNEANVVSIYNECLLSNNPDSISKVTAQFAPNVPEVHFDFNKLHANTDRLRYMLGQLYYTYYHDPNNPNALPFKPSVGCINYKNQPWTKNKQVLGLFYYLQVGAYNIKPFREFNGVTKCHYYENADIVPTLSPRDPAFPAWYAEWSKKNIE